MSLLFTSCHKDNDKARDRHTVIVYMMAENSLSSFTPGDLSEMVSSTDSIPEDCNLIVYMDKAGSVDVTPYLMEIKDDIATTIKTYNEQNSCDANTFESVIKDIAKLYPSDSYSLVMWSHGSGWIPASTSSSAKSSMHKTIGVDNNNNAIDNSGSEMEISSMREAIEQTGIHFDLIMFDACFMQCIEVAYELRNCADYIIGSPAEIPADGAPYHQILSDFYLKDEYSAAKDIATDYYNYYINKGGLVISVVKTAELTNLAQVTSTYMPTPPDIDSFDDVQKYCPWAYGSNWYPDFRDMGSLMNKALDTNSYQVWKTQMEKTIPVRLHTSTWTTEYDRIFYPAITDDSHFAGISMFLPSTKYESYGYNTAVKETQWWKDVWGE